MGYKTSDNLKTLEDLVTACGWQEGIDGKLPGVFDYIQAGYRCVWSTNWIDNTGWIEASNIGPGPDKPELLRAELADYAARGDSYSASLLRDANCPGYALWIHARDVRLKLGEPCVWPFSELNPSVHIKVKRPGWSQDEFDYRRKLHAGA